MCLKKKMRSYCRSAVGVRRCRLLIVSDLISEATDDRGKKKKKERGFNVFTHLKIRSRIVISSSINFAM